MHTRPIGVFDSGLGGLTVLQALDDLLPGEDMIYLGDTARYPYGERSREQVIESSLAIGRFLVAQGVKMIVVACNSATAAALEHLRSGLDVPVIGVVEPGLRAAARASRTGRAIVLSTRLTASSGVYEQHAAGMEGLDVASLACPGFVELVEEGRTEGREVERLVAQRLAPLLTARVDTIVLGCTHYPLLARPISSVVGRGVTLVSSADETAFEVSELLERMGWLRDAGTPGSPRRGRRVFHTTGDPQRFAELGARFLGFPLTDVRAHRFAELGDAPLGAA